MSPGRTLQQRSDDCDGVSDHPLRDGDQDTQEPIAIIGFALKFPQDATNPEAFWRLIVDGRNTMTEWPKQRMNVDAFYHPRKRNALPVRGGHFLKEDLGAFDADFFSITPAEAAAMDPGQRILLETAFSAFESAGIPMESLQGSKTSVHTGCFNLDYEKQLLADPQQLPMYTATGVRIMALMVLLTVDTDYINIKSTISMLSSRLSWFFGLTGPSMNMDSACSSSLMAVDNACQLLRQRECSMSIVAGANVMLDPTYAQTLTNMHMLSSDCLSYSFDDRANGYARGEGVGAVILKPLSSALQAGDTIRAVIRASGSNHDGWTPGITVPSSRAQARLIEETYAKARLTKQHTRFFEAHGTGTAVGDPIEAEAIADVFRGVRDPEDPLYIGAVKSNIGHLEGAAGIASLIKTILVLEAGIIPPNANFQKPNRKIDTIESPIEFPTSPIQWSDSGVRRASINSFGYGGSNSHIILDDAYSFLASRNLHGNHRTCILPMQQGRHANSRESPQKDNQQISSIKEEIDLRTPKLLVWSASDQQTLKSSVAQCQDYCLQKMTNGAFGSSFIHDLTYTLDSRRSTLPWRSCAVIESREDMKNFSDRVSQPVIWKSQKPRIAFAFTGQGAQWAGMGRELFSFDVFNKVIDHAEGYLKKLGCSWSVREQLWKSGNDSIIDRPDIAAPLTTIVQIGLVELMKVFGILPVAVVGHSIGEVAAAYCAGVITRESAFKLAYFRGKFVATIPERDTMKGAMVAVGLSSSAVIPYFDRIRPSYPSHFNLIVSCVNSPSNVTISGEESQIKHLKDLLDQDGIFAQQLRVNAAYHSPQLELIADECLEHYGALQIQKSSSVTPMISSVTGSVISAKQLSQAKYHVTNMISPVLFSQAVRNMLTQSRKALRKKIDGSHRNAIVVDYIVEIGPHAALRSPIRDIIKTLPLPRRNEVGYGYTLFRRRSANRTVLELLGHLYCMGAPVNLRRLNEADAASLTRICLVDLPSYPFNHNTRHWHESRLVRDYRNRTHGHVQLLGERSFEWNPLSPQWRCCLRGSEISWIDDHKINGQSFFPASAMMISVLEAALQMADSGAAVTGLTLRRVQFHAVLSISSESADAETRTHLIPLQKKPAHDSTQWEFRTYSRTTESWTENCSGFVEVNYANTANDEFDTGTLSYYRTVFNLAAEACNRTAEPSVMHESWRKLGYQYGECFQGITACHYDNSNRAITNVSLSTPSELDVAIEDYSVIHPTSLDSIIHSTLAATTKGGTLSTSTYVPTSIDRLWISTSGLRPSTDHVAVHATIDSETARTSKSSLFVMSGDQEKLRLTLDGLTTSFIANTGVGEDANSEATQAWYSLKRNVDLDMLTNSQTVEWLQRVCGPYSAAPRAFDSDLSSNINNTPKLVAGSDRIVDSTFDDRSNASNCCTKLEKYVEAYSFKHPSINILQIGAGNDSSTKHIIRGLSDRASGHLRCTQYVLANFLEASLTWAQKEFSAYADQMIFKHLNCETEPTQQGFAASSFDVIAMSDAIYITKNPERSLHAVRKLLKPGGKLIVHESISPGVMELGLTNGSLPKPDRSMSPLALEKEWDEMLKRTGFSGTDLIFHDLTDRDCHLLSIMFSTGVESNKSTPLGHFNCTVLVDPNSTVQSALASRLETWLREDKSLSTRIVPFSMSQASSAAPDDLLIILIDMDSPIFPTLTEGQFSMLQSLMLAAGPTLWVTQGGNDKANPGYAMIEGFARTLRIESNHLKLATLALEDLDAIDTNTSYIVQCLHQLRHGVQVEDLEDFVVQDGYLKISRICEENLLRSTIKEICVQKKRAIQSVGASRPFSIELRRQEQSSMLQFVESVEPGHPLEADQVEIEVKAVGLNASDSLSISGKSSRTDIGTEAAGIVKSVGRASVLKPGDRVCIVGSGLLRSNVRVKDCHAAHIPEGIPFARASTLPLDHLLAHYLLRCLVQLRSMDTLLIHGGHPSLARAIIGMALGTVNSVFVATPENSESEFLKKIYGENKVKLLGYEHLFHQIRRSKPQGMDVIINLTPESDFLDLITCVSPFGKFVRVQPKDQGVSEQSGISTVPSNVFFVSVDLDAVLRDIFDTTHIPLQSLLDKTSPFIKEGQNNVQIFPLSNMEQAFTSLRGVEHRDRVSVVLEEHDEIPIVKSLKPTYSLDAHASYLITGGFGALGMVIARWMASRGAQNLILLSRSGPMGEAAQQLVSELEERGVRLSYPLCDITDAIALKQILSDCSNTMPPIKGCIHTSGALKDVMYKDMSYKDWRIAVEPKVQGSWNLHSLLPSGMDFFIMTASVTGILGQAYQINYAAANTYQDGLARYRVALGEKAVTLDLGLLLTGGLSGDAMGRLMNLGHLIPISEAQICAALEYFCDPARGTREPSDAQIIVGIKTAAEIRMANRNLPDGMYHPSWRQTYSTAGRRVKENGGAGEETSFVSRMQKAECAAESVKIATEAIVQRFSRMLSVQPANINIEAPFHVSGADSLSAADLRNWIMKTFRVDIPVFNILGDTTVSTVGRMIAEKWLEASSL
ncbi:MAG: Type I Iterative PKS [Bathelium mastoideum]|nr:MAG: Type I Iterative PKS [Bathelium mastoideum]